MADTTTSETTSSAPSASDATSLGRMLRDAWQLPVLLLAMGAIVAALWYARQNRAENEWNATLAQASEQIAKNELAIARTILDEVIAPHLAEAPSGFAGRFEAVLADLGAAELPKNATQQSFDAVAKQYEKAIELKATLDEEQFARYSRMLAGAQRDSEAVAAAELAGDEAHAQELASGFGRRRLQAAYDALGQAGHPAEATRAIAAFFKEYEDFRAAQRMRAEDRAWAAALAARARMNHGHADAATERLLLEIRRAEAAASVGDAVEDATFAELCALLGECLRREGKHADAVRELDRARTLAKPSSELEGEIDLSRGLALLSLGDHAAASAVFDRAVLTEHPPAIKSQLVLGRARARASLGQREDALRDFDSIVALAEKGRISSALADECLSVLNELARSAIGEDKNVDAIDYAARVACEVGADVVKINYPEFNPEKAEKYPKPYNTLDLSFEDRVRKVVQSAGRTLLIFSGGSKVTEEKLISNVQTAMDCGANGLIFGRNMWQRPMDEALRISKQVSTILKNS